MKRILSVVTVAIIMLGCIKERQTAADLKAGDSIPDFKVEMNDGRVVRDEDLKENVSVIMFFHTSCPDCQQVLPEMQRIYDEYASESVCIVLISREDSRPSVESFWQEKDLNMPFSAQNDRKVYEKFAQSRIPRVYICEKGGIIRYVFTDDPNPSYTDFKSALEDVIH